MPSANILRIKALSVKAVSQLDLLLSRGSSPCDLLDFERSAAIPFDLQQIPEQNGKMYSNVVHVLFDREILSKPNGLHPAISKGLKEYMERYKSIMDFDYQAGEQALSNAQKYGYSNAENWKAANWGHGVLIGFYEERVSYDFFLLAFTSKIHPLPEWLKKTSEDFPQLNFSLASEGLGLLPSSLYAYNGKVIKSTARSIWSLE